MLTLCSGGVPLHGLAPVGAPTYSTDMHGPLTLSWSMLLPRGYTHPALRQGRPVELYAGTWPVFAGTMAEPDLAEGGFVAEGAQRRGERFRAVVYNAGLDEWEASTTLDTAIDAANTRGLGWVRDRSLSAVPLLDATEEQSEPYTINTLLDRYCDLNGLQWRLDAFRRVRLYTPPLTCRWAVLPGTPALPTAADDYESTVWTRYPAAVAGDPPEPSRYALQPGADTAAADRWGTQEGFYDGGDLEGPFTAAEAKALAGDLVAAGTARPAYAAGLELHRDQIATPGNTSPGLWQIEAGTQRIKQLAALTTDGALGFGLHPEWVIGATEWDTSTATIRLSPRDQAARAAGEVIARMSSDLIAARRQLVRRR